MAKNRPAALSIIYKKKEKSHTVQIYERGGRRRNIRISQKKVEKENRKNAQELYTIFIAQKLYTIFNLFLSTVNTVVILHC